MSALTSVEAVRSSRQDGIHQEQDQDRDAGQGLRRPWEQAASGHCGERQLAKLHYQHTEVEEGSDRAGG
jgi:hypothetical protein